MKSKNEHNATYDLREQVCTKYSAYLKQAIIGHKVIAVKFIITAYDLHPSINFYGAENRGGVNDEDIPNLAAHPFQNGTTPYDLAYSMGYDDICQILLDNGAEPREIILDVNTTSSYES